MPPYQVSWIIVSKRGVIILQQKAPPRQSLDIFASILYNKNMASRAKRKGKEPVAKKDNRANAAAFEKERALNNNRKLYAIVCGALLLAIVIAMLPLNTAGIINVNINGNMSLGVGESMNDYELDINVPINALEVIFGPIRTTKALPYISMKILDSVNPDYDKDEINNDPTLTLSSLGMPPSYDKMLDDAVAPIYALCCIVIISLIALIASLAVSMTGKCGMIPPLVCAVIYAVLAIVQLGIGIYTSGIAFPQSENLSVKLVAGAQTYVNFFFGAAICVAIVAFGLRRRNIYREYGAVKRGGKRSEV